MITQPKAKSQRPGKNWNAGFSLPEILVTTAIVASLCTIAIPTYIDQKKASCQNYPEGVMTQAMIQAQAYKDEYASLANGWSDLDKIATLMTSSGPASGSSFNWIELPGCAYKLSGSLSESTYTFEAREYFEGSAPIPEGEDPVDPGTNTYNIIGCLNVETGASDIRKGNAKNPASVNSARCS
jgi:type IV pilus assembly protein PilA